MTQSEIKVISDELELRKIFSDHRRNSNLIIKEVDNDNAYEIEIRMMLDKCLHYTRYDKSGHEFIESLEQQFETKRYLSPKQVIALEKWYDNTF